jgi:hypothetical protein
MFRHAFLCTIAFVCTASVPAFAQTAPVTKWEVEGLAGMAFGRVDWGGTAALPPPGAPIPTSSPVFPSWRVPSWTFGDGADFLNKLASEFGTASRITPLDALFKPQGVSGGQFQTGVRVRRALQRPYALEIGLEFGVSPVSISGDLEDGLDATAASFSSVFGEILSTGPFTSPTVTANVATATGSARELVLTGALSADTRPYGKFVPYGVAGGGLLRQSGDLVSATVTGNYSLRIGGTVPINETDTASIDYRGKTTFVLLFGGGVRRDFSPKWGIRIDGRVLMGPNPTSVEITAAPARQSATPAGFIESFTYPSLVLSNSDSTGRVSTLSGSETEFDVFSGGWQMRTRVTFGAFWRF